MGFDASKYKVILEKPLGKPEGWNGSGELVAVLYKYGSNPVSVKLVTRGKKKNGDEYEGKIMNGMPVEAARCVFGEMADLVKE